MATELYFVIAFSEIISLFLIFILLRSKENLWLKIILTIILLIPIIGVFMYLFAKDKTPPQKYHLRNENLPYGDYTRRWITMKPLLEQLYEEKKESIEKENIKLKE